MDCDSNQLTVNRLPKLEEEIIIETEPVGYNKFFTFRRLYNFVFRRRSTRRRINDFLND